MSESTQTERAAGAANPSELHARAVAAAARFLERRGCEVLEECWSCAAGCADIVAEDGGSIVFVGVSERSGADRSMPAEGAGEAERDVWERIAAAYLAEHGDVDVPVRFDLISMLVVGTDRAFMRHHVNAFSRW